MKKKILIYNATMCPRRQLDCSNLHSFLTENDYLVVDNPQEAEDILLVTCAVWDLSEKTSIEALEELKTYNKNLVVLGCLPEINKSLLDRHFEGITIPPKKIHAINELFPHEIPFEHFDKSNDCTLYVSHPHDIQKNFTRIADISNARRQIRHFIKTSVYFGPVKTFLMAKDLLIRKKTFSLKISQGCIWNCSYCAIKKAIGNLKSRPLKKIIEEAEEAICQKGYQRIRIVADDTGSYGIDIGENFVDLLDGITQIKKFFTIWLGDMNPYWIIKYFDRLNRILERKKIVSLVIPVQSGSQRIIDLMNRKYDIKMVKEIFSELKKKHKYLQLGTHILAGFPTESYEDIGANISFIRDGGVTTGTVFMLSYRPGTKCSKMDGRFSQEEKEKRVIEHYHRLKESGYQVEFRIEEGTHHDIFFSK
ncbi:MAG: radical SAM protein [Candidatus Aminicenantes bacterium]|nr:radical SAM protein [Candidatus Aminicenantes bacterium]